MKTLVRESVRRLVRSESARRLRTWLAYDANRPSATNVAGPARFDAALLHLQLNRVYDLPEVEIDPRRRRSINVLVPAFDFGSMSAGFLGVFQVALSLRATGWNVRIVLFDNFAFDRQEFARRFSGYPGLERFLDEVEVDYIGERRRPLCVSPDDTCVATVWYSAHFARKIGRVLGGRRFLYLIQDYEAAFFPGNSLSALADETYGMDFAALFSTEPLRRYFLGCDIGGIASRGVPCISFDNACAARLASREDFVARCRSRPRKRVAFYSRPAVDRNMFTLAALAMISAWERGIFTPGEWDCVGMGLGNAELELLGGVRSVSLPRMDLRQYGEAIGDFDVCLSLMASPHPSLVPMDCAGSGSLVVTNTFRTKDERYLRSLSGNVVPVEPSLESIVAGLAEAARRSEDFDSRHRHAAEMRYPREWRDSIGPAHVRFVKDHVLDPAIARLAMAVSGAAT
jgi:hypothetical protein